MVTHGSRVSLVRRAFIHVVVGAGAVFLGTMLASPAASVAPFAGLQVSRAATACDARTPISSLPVTIGSGSYYLTQNLALLTGGDGITLIAGNVTIDLNGFTLAGNRAAGTGSGIVLGGVAGVAITNGTIREWGQYGIEGNSTSESTFSRLHLEENGVDGVRLSGHNTVSECIASGNAVRGIVAGSGSIVLSCTAQLNGKEGLETSHNCTIVACVALENGGHGIAAGTGCVLEDCVARDNIDHGFSVSDDCVLRGCTSEDNMMGIGSGTGCVIQDCAANLNSDDGIYTVSFGYVLNCSASKNGRTGINATGEGNRIEGNHVLANGVVGIGANSGGSPFILNLITRNTSLANASDYNIGTSKASFSSDPATAGAWDNIAY